MRSFLLLLLPLLLVAASVPSRAQLTESNVLCAVPAPREVAIDGRLDEWDRSGAITLCYDVEVLLATHRAELVAMYDREALYVGIEWRDPTPMINHYDPATDVDRRVAFHADSIQFFFNDAGSRRNLFAWHYTKGNRPGAVVTFGRAWWRQNPIVFVDAAREYGVSQAFSRAADGKGYTQEIRIPWPAVNPEKTFHAGDEIPCMLHAVWGSPTGKGWMESHIIDLVQPGAPHSGHFWEIGDILGRLKLMPEGNLQNMPTGVRHRPKTLQAGTVPVRALIPADAHRFTLAISDTAGKRVRNLAGDFSAEDYTVEIRGAQRLVEVKWDGLDDRGQLVIPGKYHVIGLSHRGLDAIYEMSYYNPGTPPWETADGGGGWMSDHDAPKHVASAGDWVVLACEGAEGGSGIIGLGPDGKKRWGEKSGATAITADHRYVYFMLANQWAKKTGLARLVLSDGSYAPYQVDGEDEYPVAMTTIFGGPPPGDVRSLAVHDGTLALAMSEGKLALLDANTGRLRQTIDVEGLQNIAVGGGGHWYALAGGRLVRIEISTGRCIPVRAADLGKPVALAVDARGNVVIADGGPASQIRVYSPHGELLRTAGKSGGRPIRGVFEPQAMIQMSGVAVDAADRTWVVEHWNYPRRVSVWGTDGRLVRDYIGNTGYSGVSGYLHDSDPTLAYIGAVEFRIDRAQRRWTPTQTLWVADHENGESFSIDPTANAAPMRFRSEASGRPVEYLYAHDARSGGGNVVYQPRGGGWQPVAAICAVGHVSGRIDSSYVVRAEPGGEFIGLNAYDGCFWNDENGDGKAQRSECLIVPTERPVRLSEKGGADRFGLPLDNGWGGRIGRDLTIFADGIVRYDPTGFSAEGAPRYGPEGMRKLPVDERGDLVPVTDEKLLLCVSMKGYPKPTSGILGLDDRTGEVRWTYPNHFPFVHGSHRAPKSRPGLVIGPLKICGVADLGTEAGKVFLMRGNLGEDYFMTTDGLYVGALFKDGRLPSAALPTSEELLVGKSLAGFSNGGEPFNGWFGRQADGKIRLVNGLPRQGAAIVEVTGLETIVKFTADALTLDAALLTRCEQDNLARATVGQASREYVVHVLTQPLVLDGELSEWAAIPAVTIGEGPNTGSARLAYDGQCLYVAFSVTDTSPWKNEGKDFTRLFKTGDAVDVQLRTAAGPANRATVNGSDMRVVISQLAGAPVAVLMRPVSPDAPADAKVRYHSPVGDRYFDRVEIIRTARVSVRPSASGYVVEAALPLEALDLVPKRGTVIAGDLGFISSDAAGLINVARTYWANPATNIVSDLPTEAWLYPAAWGTLRFE